jgi:hypothetical protein
MTEANGQLERSHCGGLALTLSLSASHCNSVIGAASDPVFHYVLPGRAKAAWVSIRECPPECGRDHVASGRLEVVNAQWCIAQS